MSCVSDARDGDHDVIRFAWDAGGGGTLRITWRDGAVAGLTVTFDALTLGVPGLATAWRSRHDLG